MKRLLVLAICLTFMVSPVFAKEKKIKASKESKSEAEKTTSKGLISNEWLNVEILPSDKEKITEYYKNYPQTEVGGKKGKKKKTLPPGLKKKVARGGELPPGWQKKVARGEVLDAEVYKNAKPLPIELLRRLPAQPEGSELIKVEGKIIRLIKATRTILDVFDIPN